MKKVCFIMMYFLIFVLLNTFSTNCTAESDEELVEKVARKLIIDIYNNHIDGILELIPDNGLLDYDVRIPKEKIKDDLFNADSYLYNYLYKPLNTEDLILCAEKLNNQLYVSPYAFYHVSGNDYTVYVSKTVEIKDNDYYSVSMWSNSKVNNSCRLRIWYLSFKKTNDTVYLERNFYP